MTETFSLTAAPPMLALAFADGIVLGSHVDAAVLQYQHLLDMVELGAAPGGRWEP